MDIATLLDLYDTTVRQYPGKEASTRVERRDGLVLVNRRYCFVSWWEFDETQTDQTIRTLIEDIRKPGQPVIWRIYAHDGPEGLGDRLAAHGFIPQPPGRLMVCDLTSPPPQPDADVIIRKVEDAAAYRDHVAVNNAAFGSNFPDDVAEMKRALSDKYKPLFVAYDADGTPLASACLWAPDDSPFCGLHGGGVIEAARGRGLYRALTMHRLHLARALGYRYAGVDANEKSGPRLERMGFKEVISETTWTLGGPL